MCIIVVKPSGVKLPTDEVLRRCFAKNPDGAGFMYPENGKVRIRKGMMKADDWLAGIHAIPDVLDKTLVAHARIGTHGHKNAACTHPFPVTTDVEQLKATDLLADLAVAHNGILSCGSPQHDISDTMHFIVEVLAKQPKLIDPQAKGTIDLLLSMAIGTNRFASMDGTGNVMLFGSFVDAEDGCKYSNDGFKAPVALTGWTYVGTHQSREPFKCNSCRHSSVNTKEHPCDKCWPHLSKPFFKQKLALESRSCDTCALVARDGTQEPCKTCMSHASRPQWRKPKKKKGVVAMLFDGDELIGDGSKVWECAFCGSVNRNNKRRCFNCMMDREAVAY